MIISFNMRKCNDNTIAYIHTNENSIDINKTKCKYNNTYISMCIYKSNNIHIGNTNNMSNVNGNSFCNT